VSNVGVVGGGAGFALLHEKTFLISNVHVDTDLGVPVRTLGFVVFGGVVGHNLAFVCLHFADFFS
jgi:hypothetical protein